MEHEGSLPHSQKPDPCPYSLPKQPIPYFPYPISRKSTQILSSHLRQGLSSSLWNLLKHEESRNYYLETQRNKTSL